MATTTNWSELTEYVDVHRDELITKASADAKSIKYFYTMLGVKHKDQVPTLDSTVEFQDGSACGWDPAGSDNFGAINIEVNPVEIEKEWCQRDLEKSFANHQLNWAAGRETLPYSEALVNSNLNAINVALDQMVWMGNSTAGVTGITQHLDNMLSDIVTVDFSGLSITDKVDAMVQAIPNSAFKYGYEGKVYLFLSYTDFRAYIMALNATCCANRGVIDASVEELPYAGDSRVILVPVEGLEGQNKMVASPARGLVYGTDIESSENIFDLWFERKDAKFLFRVLFMAGTAVKFPAVTVYGKE